MTEEEPKGKYMHEYAPDMLEMLTLLASAAAPLLTQGIVNQIRDLVDRVNGDL